MKRLRWRERKRFVRMRIKNKTFDHVAIGKEKSRYWESKNNLNVWMRTIQDKRKKKNNKEIKMRELKICWSKNKYKEENTDWTYEI